MTSGTGTITALSGTGCSSGVCTMTTPGVDGEYRAVVEAALTTQGSGGTCTTGTLSLMLNFRSALAGTTYSTSLFPIANLTTGVFASSVAFNSSSVQAANDTISAPREFRAKAGTAITFAVNQTIGSNCTTPQVFAISVALYGPLGY